MPTSYSLKSGEFNDEEVWSRTSAIVVSQKADEEVWAKLLEGYVPEKKLTRWEKFVRMFIKGYRRREK